jgi:hypothetical protein
VGEADRRLLVDGGRHVQLEPSCTDLTSNPIQIADLATPQLPVTVRTANATLRPFASRIQIDERSVIDAAISKTGCDDFGPSTFRDGLHALTDSLDHEAGLSPLGRVLARQMVVGLLVARLRVVELRKRNPEIDDEVIDAPIFIAGLPRTGTTHLHYALSRDERLRSMPYWESLEPIPALDGSPPRDGKPDPRIARCAMGLRLVHHAMPLFPAMHEMFADEPHEEIQLLAVHFESMYFEAGYNVPSYSEWYQAHDQTGAYLWLRTMLQAMQWLRGGRRWVLKSPQHLENLPALFAAFPDAVVVQTHRDPVAVTASLVTMEAYTRRMQHDPPVDLRAVGAYWSNRIEVMLRASIVDRARVDTSRILDVPFREFMADQVGTIERAEKFAGLDFDHAARRSITRYLDSKPRGRHGTIEYDLARFGIDPAERRDALRFYTDRFDLAAES